MNKTNELKNKETNEQSKKGEEVNEKLKVEERLIEVKDDDKMNQVSPKVNGLKKPEKVGRIESDTTIKEIEGIESVLKVDEASTVIKSNSLDVSKNELKNISMMMPNRKTTSYNLIKLKSDELFSVIDVVPRFLTIKGFGEPDKKLTTQRNEKYAQPSVQMFGYGTNDSHVILESVGLKPQIVADEREVGIAPDGVIITQSESRESFAQKLEYYLSIPVKILKMITATDAIIKNVKLDIKHERTLSANDLVDQYEMYQGQFVNQEVPLLYAGGIAEWPNFILDILRGYLQNEQHLPLYEKITSENYNLGIKYFEDVLVYTDQHCSKQLKLFEKFLFDHKYDPSQLLRLYTFLNLPGTCVDFVDRLEYERTLYAILQRTELDGLLLLHAASKQVRMQFLYSQVEAMSSLQLLSMLSENESKMRLRHTPTEIFGTSGIKVMNALKDFTEKDAIIALACENNLFWIDVEIVTRDVGDAAGAVAIMFSILLWYNMFPAIAIDCGYNLIPLLFECLLCLHVTDYQDFWAAIGTTRLHSRPNTIGRKGYLSGDEAITFMHMNDEELRKYPKMLALRKLLKTDGKRVSIARSDDLPLPHYYNERTVYIPWEFMSIDINDGGEFDRRLVAIKGYIASIITSYKKKVGDTTSRSGFGQSRDIAFNIFDLFTGNSNFASELDFAKMIPLDFNILRYVSSISPYYLGDNFTGDLRVRTSRPAVFGKQIIKNRVNIDEWNYIATDQPVIQFDLMMPLCIYISLEGSYNAKRDINLFQNSLQPVEIFDDFRNYSIRGMRIGNLIGFLSKYILNEPEDQFYKILQAQFTTLRTSSSYNRLFELFSKITNQDTVDLFQTEVFNNVKTFVDKRSSDLCVSMCRRFAQLRVRQQEDNSHFGKPLKLLQDNFIERLDAAKFMFDPSTTPIDSLTRGIFIMNHTVSVLDPNEKFEVEAFIDNNETLIYMWDEQFITSAAPTNLQTTYSLVLKLEKEDGSELVIKNSEELSTKGIKIIFIISENTGGMSEFAFNFIETMIMTHQVILYLPDLYVMKIEKELDISVTSDIPNIMHCKMLVAKVNSIVNIEFGKTKYQRSRVGQEIDKQKLIFLSESPFLRTTVLSGVTRFDRPDTHNFQIANWSMFARGSGDEFSSLSFYENDQTDPVLSYDQAINQSITDDELFMTVEKIAYPQANFCNLVRIYSDNQSFSKPEVRVNQSSVKPAMFSRAPWS